MGARFGLFFDLLTNAIIADRKFLAVNLAFYLPDRFDRTQRGSLAPRNQKEVSGAAQYLMEILFRAFSFCPIW